MAMTKKEQAEMAALRRAVLVAGAFVRTERVLPDVFPTHTSGRVYGWVFSGSSGIVRAWSEIGANGPGTKEDADKRFRNGSQGMRAMHSTALRCLKAHRWEVEQECVRNLADIDEAIERERAEPTP